MGREEGEDLSPHANRGQENKVMQHDVSVNKGKQYEDGVQERAT